MAERPPVHQSPNQDTPPKKPRRRTRTHLGRVGRGIIWWFGLFALLSILVMVALGLYIAYIQIDNVRLFQEQTVQWAAQMVNTWIQEQENHLRLLARHPDLMDLPPEKLESALRQTLQSSAPFLSVSLIDARAGNRGTELLRVTKDKTYAGGESRYDEEWFSPTLNQGSYISSVSWSSLGTPSLALAQAVKVEGETVGIIAVQADLSWTYGLLRQFRAEESRGSYIYVVNEQGQPFMHEHAPYVNSREPKQSIEGVGAAIEGKETPPVYAGLNPDGHDVIGVYYVIEKARWFIIAEQPVPWIMARLSPLLYGAGGILGLSILAAITVGIYISRRVAGPIVRLREGARQIGAGDIDYRIPVPKRRDELAELAEEFNRAAEGIQQSQARLEAWSQELEVRVEERTRELRRAFEQQQQQAEERETLLHTIRQMSSPVIPVTKGIIVMPIVGTLDSDRAQRVMEDLLAGIEHEQSHIAIIDITGLAVVDTAVAQSLLQAAEAAQLLGAKPILVGITPEVAETVVQLGVELHALQTAATLQEGLRLASRMLRQRRAAVPTAR